MAIDCQTRNGADQFTGAANEGRWDFSAYNFLPRTTRIVLTLMSYSVAGADVGEITFFAIRPGGLATDKVLLGRATATQMTGPGTEGNYTACGKVLPREPGDGGAFWQVQALSSGKTATATACVDFIVQPFPDTSPEDP